MATRRRTVHSIIPPYMLEHIARRGTPAQQARARAAIAASEELRERRAAAPLVARALEAPPAGKQRSVYDAEEGYVLPGRLVRSEGQPPTADPAVNEAYDGCGATYDLYYDAYQRNSIDGRGMPLISSVHYGQGYDNAFWDGRQMVFGDGDEDLPPDEQLFRRFTVAVDIIAHELTHGVTDYEARLAYLGQPGALNESFSDVFGALAKQHLLGQTAAEADWLIGEGLFTANVQGVALRSMKAPGTAYDDPLLGKDPQPAHMDDYIETTEDYGGVHYNSGIPNHAFYLAAVEIGGYAWEKAGAIWYRSLTEKLRANASFQEAAQATIEAAGELYGADSREQQAVRSGWAAVGVESEGEPLSCWQRFLAWLRSLFGG